jgi:hypothetical protein
VLDVMKHKRCIDKHKHSMTHLKSWVEPGPCGRDFETGGKDQVFPVQCTEVVGTSG